MKIEQTYIFKKGKPVYFVSTINRQSSTIPPMVYAETMAYKINDQYEQLEMVEQDEASPDSVMGHERVINKLRRNNEN